MDSTDLSQGFGPPPSAPPNPALDGTDLLQRVQTMAPAAQAWSASATKYAKYGLDRLATESYAERRITNRVAAPSASGRLSF